MVTVYPDGRVCISILHAPGEDPNGYELASERWTPVHTVIQNLFYVLCDFLFYLYLSFHIFVMREIMEV